MAPFFRAAFGFMARVLGRTVLCSGLLWCTVLWDWAREKSVSSVFSCSPGTVVHSAGAGWLDFGLSLS